MSSGKLKINIGELNVELEGDNDLLYRSFSDIRTDGCFKSGIEGIRKIETKLASPKDEPVRESVDESETVETIIHPEVIDIATHLPTADLPDFNSLILEKKSFTTSNWMLLMAWSVSHKGKIKFTKKQLKKIYCNSCKHIGLRSKDYVSNFMSLLLNDYIIMIEKNTFALTETGYHQAYTILTEQPADIFSEAI